jgi:hypothetical protein
MPIVGTVYRAPTTERRVSAPAYRHGAAVSDTRQSPQSTIAPETPSKRLANLFKRMVRESDECERAAAASKWQPKQRDTFRSNTRLHK